MSKALKQKVAFLKRKGFHTNGNLFVHRKLRKTMSLGFVATSSLKTIKEKIAEPNIGTGWTIYFGPRPSIADLKSGKRKILVL